MRQAELRDACEREGSGHERHLWVDEVDAGFGEGARGDARGRVVQSVERGHRIPEGVRVVGERIKPRDHEIAHCFQREMSAVEIVGGRTLTRDGVR